MTDTESEDDDTFPDALITLRRTRRSARDLLRTYQVLLDGGEVTRIRRGQTLEFTVLPGSHSLQLVLDQDSSRLVTFDLEDGDRAAFVCDRASASASGDFRITLQRVQP